MSIPNANQYDQNVLHGNKVHRELSKTLESLTQSFYIMDHFANDEKGKSVVVASSTSMERPAAHVVSVSFDKATAQVQYDTFSHGYKMPTISQKDIDVSNLPVDQAVKVIVDEMAKADPLFGSHVRQNNDNVAKAQSLQSERMVALSRCGGPSSWS